MGARWYSGADAVFRSRDSVFGELAMPISLNRYTYAAANPLATGTPTGDTSPKAPAAQTKPSPAAPPTPPTKTKAGPKNEHNAEQRRWTLGVVSPPPLSSTRATSRPRRRRRNPLPSS